MPSSSARTPRRSARLGGSRRSRRGLSWRRPSRTRDARDARASAYRRRCDDVYSACGECARSREPSRYRRGALLVRHVVMCAFSSPSSTTVLSTSLRSSFVLVPGALAHAPFTSRPGGSSVWRWRSVAPEVSARDPSRRRRSCEGRDLRESSSQSSRRRTCARASPSRIPPRESSRPLRPAGDKRARGRVRATRRGARATRRDPRADSPELPRVPGARTPRDGRTVWTRATRTRSWRASPRRLLATTSSTTTTPSLRSQTPSTTSCACA